MAIQPQSRRILVVDDEPGIVAYLEQPSDLDLRTTLALARRRRLLENRRLASLLGG